MVVIVMIWYHRRHLEVPQDAAVRAATRAFTVWLRATGVAVPRQQPPPAVRCSPNPGSAKATHKKLRPKDRMSCRSPMNRVSNRSAEDHRCLGAERQVCRAPSRAGASAASTCASRQPFLDMPARDPPAVTGPYRARIPRLQDPLPPPPNDQTTSTSSSRPSITPSSSARTATRRARPRCGESCRAHHRAWPHAQTLRGS